MIELDSLTKTYGKGLAPALDHVSLQVKPGEIFGFIGPNGAGKTTAIKIITGILAPDEGSGGVRVAGVDMLRDPVEAKRRIGYVPDNHEIYDRLTGLEYLSFLADVYGVPQEARKARMDRFLALFELTGAVGDLIKSYSHGMKQKLSLIGALLHEPPLWILDEPMTGLDPRAAHALKEEMRGHCKKGNTVFFSTHVLDVAERLCDRVGIISKGRLIAVGTLDELRGERKDETLEALFFALTEGV